MGGYHEPITLHERKKIQKLHEEGLTKREISENLGLNYVSIFREFRRCGKKDDYNAEIANENAIKRIKTNYTGNRVKRYRRKSKKIRR